MTVWILLCVLSQSELPANHPPIGAPSANQSGGQSELPPNHPHIGSPGDPQLPPNHPHIEGQGDQQLPPNHPHIEGQGDQQLPPNHPHVGGTGAQSVGSVPPSAEDLLKKLDATPDLKSRDKSFEMSISLGKLYMTQARYADAQGYFEQGLAKSAPVRDFYLAQKKLLGSAAVPTAAEAGCSSTVESTMDALFAAAQKHSKANKRAEAVACSKAALHGTIEAENALAQTQFLKGDAAAAVKTFTHALELFDGNLDARYGRAAALLDSRGDDVPSLKQAEADFAAVIAQAPSSPKAKQAQRFLDRTRAAMAAGGLSKIAPVPVKVAAAPPQMPPHLSPETMEAFQNAPRTPEMNDKFATLIADGEGLLASGNFQGALDSFKQVMPYQPDNARLRAGMAWALIRLNKQPMADRVWGVASQTPEAVDALGDSLKKKGDAAGAKELWTRLAASVPEYAPKLAGKL